MTVFTEDQDYALNDGIDDETFGTLYTIKIYAFFDSYLTIGFFEYWHDFYIRDYCYPIMFGGPPKLTVHDGLFELVEDQSLSPFSSTITKHLRTSLSTFTMEYMNYYKWAPDPKDYLLNDGCGDLKYEIIEASYRGLF